MLAMLMAPFNERARLFTKGRKQLFERLRAVYNGNTKPVLWLHAASLGEFEQGRPLIEKFRLKYPDYRILLTFYSPSGYEIRKNYQGADDVFYLPKDTRSNAKRFFDIVKPQVGVLVKYEFWYYLMDEAVQRNITMISVATVLRKDHMLFKSFGKPFLKVMKGFQHFFVQDQATFDLLKAVAINQVTVSGDTRYDRVAEIAANAQTLPRIERFLEGKPCFVIGSSWPGDIEQLVPLIATEKFGFKYIIAPHNITEGDISTLKDQLPVEAVRFSQVDEQTEVSHFEVLIIDNIGMLSSLYRYGRYAYLGGGLRGALHNTLEAAVYGIPVLFGEHPNNRKFKEAIELLEIGGAIAVKTGKDLLEVIQDMEADDSKRLTAGEQSAALIQKHVGATDKIITFLAREVSI